MTNLVRQVQQTLIPHPDGYGRIARIVIDVDMNAVHDYVMREMGAIDTPWPAKAMEEMVEHITDLARNENTVAEMLKQWEVSRL